MSKIDVLAFNGDIMDWRKFWEQCKIAIHSRTQLKDTGNLAYMYLRQSLKNGPALHILEGVLGSGSEYDKAIKCLQKPYDKPCLLH